MWTLAVRPHCSKSTAIAKLPRRWASAPPAPSAVTTPYGSTTSAGTFTYDPPPTIASHTPTFGGTGTVVTITGAHFTWTTAVSIGGTPAASFSIVNDSTIQATVGGGATGHITVTTPYGSATTAGTFTYFQPPTITSFTPLYGVTGTVLTITGTNFTGTTAVSFNGNGGTLNWTGSMNAASFTVINDTTISATVGNYSPGQIIVTTPGGQAVSTAIFSFVILTAHCSPPSPANYGTPVQLSASSTGLDNPEYQFFAVYNAQLGLLSVPEFVTIQDYSLSSTCTWTPTLAENYTVWVEVREHGSTSDYTTYVTFPYAINSINAVPGDWWMFHHDPQHTGCSPFTGPASPVQKWAFQTGNMILSSPAIGADGTIYVGSYDGDDQSLCHQPGWHVQVGICHRRFHRVLPGHRAGRHHLRRVVVMTISMPLAPTARKSGCFPPGDNHFLPGYRGGRYYLRRIA